MDNNYQYLLQDAVFGHIFSKPKYCLWLLQSIFPDLGIKQVKVTPQKVIKDKLGKPLRDFFAYFHGKINIENEYIKEINHEIGEFIDSTEWGGQNMNLEMLREDERLDTEVAAMKKMVNNYRTLGVSEEKIIDLLIQDYGYDFTKQRIERLVKTGK